MSARFSPTPDVNRRQLLNLAERNEVTVWLEGDRLKARWIGPGQMPPGADGFLRRFRDDLVQALQERDAAGTPPTSETNT